MSFQNMNTMRLYNMTLLLILFSALLFVVACNNQEKEPDPPDDTGQVLPIDPPDDNGQVLLKPGPTPAQLAELLKTAEQVKKAFEVNYRIEKTATGYSLGGLKFNDETTNALYSMKGWTFIINQKKKGTIEITAPGVGTSKFKYDNSGNLEPLIE